MKYVRGQPRGLRAYVMTHLRTYIAGLGSGGALVAAVIVALIALGGVVAVEGLPDSSQSASAEDVLVQNEVPATNASVALAAGPRQRAQSKVGASKSSQGKSNKAGSRGSGPSFGDSETNLPQALPPAEVPSEVPSLTPPPDSPSPSPPKDPPHHNPPNPPPPPPTIPTPVPSEHGPVGGLVGVVNETVRGTTGVDPHLPGVIAPVTDPIDEVITGLTGGRGGSVPSLP